MYTLFNLKSFVILFGTVVNANHIIFNYTELAFKGLKITTLFFIRIIKFDLGFNLFLFFALSVSNCS